MLNWKPWKSVLAGAVIGFLEAAGSEQERRRARPLAVVRYEDRHPDAGGEPPGLWFLEPIPRPVPEVGGQRRESGRLSLDAITPTALRRVLGRRLWSGPTSG